MREVVRYVKAVAVGDACNDSPLVVGVTGDKCAVLVGDAYNVVLRVADIVVLLVIVAERINITFSIGVEAELCSVGAAAENKHTTVVIVERCRNTVDGR